MKKKIALILLSILTLFILAIIIVPYLFKDEIKDEILKYANQNFDGEVQIEDYDLSLLSNFPEFTFNFEGVKVIDTNKVELLNIKNASAKINSKDFLLTKSISIESIIISQPKINYRLSADTVNNDTITKKDVEINEVSDPLDEDTGDSQSQLSFNINSYEIVEGTINIKDENNNDFIKISNLNHNGFGVYEGNNLSVNTSTLIEDITIIQDKTTLLEKTKIQGDLNLDLNFDDSIYSLKENSLSINNIKLNWVGVIKEIEDSYDIDLRFDTPDSKFKDLLAIIPEHYKKDFDKIETKGEFNIEGYIKGIYNENMMPGFDIKAQVSNASIKYPDMPEKLSDINLLMKINMPQGDDLDQIVIDIPSASAKVADNSVGGNFKAKNLISDPDLNANLLANIDLSKVRDAIPMEKNEDIDGKINADMFFKGKMSDLENEDYEKFEAKGKISLKDFTFSSNLFNDKIVIDDANMDISPQFLYLNSFNFKLGKSDIQAKGKVSKYLEYFLKDKQLSGNLDIKSNTLIVSDFMPKEEVSSKGTEADETKQEQTKKAEREESEMEVIQIPANIDFTNNITIDNYYYGNIKAKNVKGLLGLKNQEAYLKNVSMNMFDGVIKVDGKYSSKDTLAPKTDFDLALNNIDIHQLSETFEFVEKVAPIIESAEGKVSAKIDFKTTLDSVMDPVYETMYSKGNIKTSNISLSNTGFLNDLGDVLNVEELKKDPNVEDINLSYSVEKGIMTIAPFKLNIADIKSDIKGSSNIGSQTIDMDISMIFPRKYLSEDANNIVNSAVSLANSFGAKLSVGENIDVNAIIDGNIKSPDYSLSYGPEKDRTPEEYLKKETDKLIDKAKKDAEKDLKKKAKNLLNDLF
ncbi:MAG: AsmA-like C-terminal region-containing protein [Bacteroidota bacterium]